MSFFDNWPTVTELFFGKEETKLATWLENNHHKFIFYTYWGGTGGEYVCNYLTKHLDLDLYNAKALTFDNAYNNSEDLDKFNSAVTNRYNFTDPLLCDSLANEFQTSEEEELNKTPFDLKTDTWLELATLITRYADRDGKVLDNDMLEDFNNQDKKYLIRIHRILPYIKLFNKSKIYVVKAGKWHGYTSILAKTKLGRNLIDILACTLDDINHNISYIKSHHQDWVDHFNITLISFDDIFTGKWVSKEFKLDKKKFNKAMIKWDKQNTKYLKQKGIQIPKNIKRLNQGLY